VRMERMLQFTSHELKTPIAGVRALLQSLSLGSIPADAQARFIQSGIGECDRLEHLAETILAYQRAVVRGGGAQPQPLRGDELVGEVLAHRARTFGTEALEVAPAAPVTVWADRDAFRVVLENLLDNARKYGGGKVEVGTKADGTEWSVTVRDHGQGFDPKLADRLFDPFERREQGAVTHGSGLGLSISRTLARQMGGDLTASSDGAGKGACFRLTLKIAPAGSVVEAAAHA
jgi:signal transduction histidine kinase